VPDQELQTLQKLLARSKAAQDAYSKFTQEQVDEIFKAVRLLHCLRLPWCVAWSVDCPCACCA
jgi:hypothetical protein